MKYVRTLIVTALAFLASPAFAQWQVPLNSVPIGLGGGKQGFGAVIGTGGNSGKPLISQGASPPLYTTLSIAGGGTGATTQAGAATALFPAAVRAGDVPYWNGAIWTTLSGNNSGSNCFGENASGVPSWVTCSGGGGTPGGSSGQVQYNNAGAFGGFTVGGDATLNTGTGALTLATVNANVGSFGSATSCVAFTTNAKGLITAASAVTCTPAVGSITGMGTGIAAGLATGFSAAGGFVQYGGPGGTPTALNLTNATLLPVSTGISGLGTGVATALAVNVGTAGAFITNGGALGTPSSGTGTNITGVPVSTGISGMGTGVAAVLANNTNTNNAVVKNNAGAILQASPADPTGTTTELMMGLGSTCTITPVQSTRMHIEFQGAAQNSGAGGVVSVQPRFGTGGAPANAGALAGATVGSKPHSLQASANEAVFFRLGGNITSLTVGTAYWLDVAVSNLGTGSTASITGVSCDAHEIP